MRALIPREGTAPVRDRLLMTLFIAALVHGMIILGLTFGGSGQRSSPPPGIDVLLVSDELPTAARNDTAAYLAQRTQQGSGNTRQAVAAHNRSLAAPPPPQAGSDRGMAAAGGRTAGARADERVLATSAARADIRYFTAAEDAAASIQAQAQALQSTVQALPAAPAADDTEPVRLRGPQRDELWIAPDSRASIVAPYLDNWRRRVERIGTLNYPTAARHAGVTASPVLEVAIDADGRLRSAQVRRSSGYPDLDQAALAILKLASPFDPFPPDLAARYRSLRFAYEWKFIP